MSLFFAKNFKYSEIACPCCGKDRPLDPKLVYLLQSLREKLGKPICISKGGGLRCRKYNKKIGGYPSSPHLIGRAVDISAKMNIIELAVMARNIGFTRIGLYPYNHFIHIDIVRPYKSASWVRDKNRNYHYWDSLEQAGNFMECITNG